MRKAFRNKLASLAANMSLNDVGWGAGVTAELVWGRKSTAAGVARTVARTVAGTFARTARRLKSEGL